MKISVCLLLCCMSCAAPLSFDPVNDYLEVYPDPTDQNILQGRTPLYFALIQSLGGLLSLYDGSGSVAGVKVGLDRINNDTTLLPGYTLHYTFADSKCNKTESFKAFFSQVLREPIKLSVLGAGCSPVTEATAEISHFYNLTQISCVSSSSALMNRVRFPYYYQMLVAEETMAYAYFSIIKEYGWKKVALIVQNERLFTNTIGLLKKLLDGIGYTYSEKLFENHKGIDGLGPEPFDKTSRIFLISAYAHNARKLLCKAYDRGIKLPKYLLLTFGWYRRLWWRAQDEDLNCSVAERESVLPASLAFLNYKFITKEDKDRVSSTGITGGGFLEAEKPFQGQPPLNMTFFEYSQYCHDGVWTLAYALNKTLNDISESSLNQNLAEAYNVSQPFRLEDFNYASDLLLKIIFKNIEKTMFDGVTGPVMFNDQGIRILNELVIFQFRNVKSPTNGSVLLDWVKIGNVINGAAGVDNLTFKYQPKENITTVWQGMVPYDGVPINITVTVNILVTVLYVSLASVGIVFAITCFFFNFIFRNSKLIRLASSKLNYLIIIGVIILYIDIIFAAVPSTNVDIISVFCNLTPWMTAFGYSLCFGTILVKMGRVYYIFNNPSTKKKNLKDWILILAVLLMVAVDLVALITYTVVLKSLNIDGGLTAKRLLNSGNPSDTKGPQAKITKYYGYFCTSTSRDILLGVIYGCKMVLQVIALVLAFSIRKVKVKGLDDSKFVAAAIYVTSSVLAVIIVSTYSVKTYINAMAALFYTGFFVGTTVILILAFVPLMVRLYKDPDGEQIFKKSELGDGTSNMNTNSMNIDLLVNTNSDADMNILRKKVVDLEIELETEKKRNKALRKTEQPEKVLGDLVASNMIPENPFVGQSSKTIWDMPEDEQNENGM